MDWVIKVYSKKTPSNITKYLAEYQAKGAYTEDINNAKRYYSETEALKDVRLPDIEHPIMLLT